MPHATKAKRREYLRRYYAKNRERILATNWAKKNPDKRRAYIRAYQTANKEKLNEYQRAYYAKNRAVKSAQARRRYYADHEVHIARSRKHYQAAVQRGARYAYKGTPATRKPPLKCECCGHLPGVRALHIDHNHATGKFRGWICGKCNVGIGMLGDTLRGVKDAVAYLERCK